MGYVYLRMMLNLQNANRTKAILLTYGQVFIKFRLHLSKGHTDDIQTGLENMKNIHLLVRSPLSLIVYQLKHIIQKQMTGVLSHFAQLPGVTCKENTLVPFVLPCKRPLVFVIMTGLCRHLLFSHTYSNSSYNHVTCLQSIRNKSTVGGVPFVSCLLLASLLSSASISLFF